MRDSRVHRDGHAASFQRLRRGCCGGQNGCSLTVGQGLGILLCRVSGCLALHHLVRCFMIQSVKARSKPMSRAICSGSTRLCFEVSAEAANDSLWSAAFGGKPLAEWGSFVSSNITASKTDLDDSGFALTTHAREAQIGFRLLKPAPLPTEKHNAYRPQIVPRD